MAKEAESEASVNSEVLEEFAAAAQLGRERRGHWHRELHVETRSRDPAATFRADVHAFIASIVSKPRSARRGWWNRPACTVSEWRRGAR
jgi:hypothetical protein